MQKQEVQIDGIAHQFYITGPHREKMLELVRAAFAPDSHIVTLPTPREGHAWVQQGPSTPGPNRDHVQFYWQERPTAMCGVLNENL